MRTLRFMLIACCIPLHGAAAQTTDRKDCPPADTACSAAGRGVLPINSLAFAPRSEGALIKGEQSGLTVAPLVLVEPGGRTRLLIEVSRQQALPKNSFVRIRGLPSSVTVSQGHSVASGVWAIPIDALPDLTIAAPDSLAGWSEIAVTLAIADGAVLAESKTKLVVASRAEARAASARYSTTPEDQDRAQQFHAQGMEQIKIGNVAGARRFFELAAEAGLASSVMELAGTYDPNELGKFGAFGPRPDVETAQRLYRKAHQLGAANAEERLRRLGAQ
jgi:hypothetical protein